MDRSNIAVLIGTQYESDEIGRQIPTLEVETTVFCDISSISLEEITAAGKIGLKPQYKITLFRYDYDGQKLVNLEGKRYSVYRTYLRRDEMIELYLEEKAGI